MATGRQQRQQYELVALPHQLGQHMPGGIWKIDTGR